MSHAVCSESYISIVHNIYNIVQEHNIVMYVYRYQVYRHNIIIRTIYTVHTAIVPYCNNVIFY